MKNGEVTYQIPGRTKKLELALRMGDTKRTVTIQLAARPNVELPRATVKFPPISNTKTRIVSTRHGVSLS